ncbi:MAG: GIY-YIG nuclease family protein [Phaeodactylibacter sp.]|nr:GIY-YIG nuclease family protein [Phaeodactylibacter sp.]MCB9301733.1 GIY-YIG nuclease family protein [Lewinellaceae bacterium]HQU59680.1 GIY-YIG nuclease family protein [Saprospiraceae bacterium]
MKTKKELKEAYRNMKFRMGVYQIRNKTNGKIFIGSSTNLDAIWNRHRLQLNMGSHPVKALQDDWKALGEENFAYEILEEIKEVEDQVVDYSKEAKLAEELYLEELQPFGDRGYNKQ